MKVTSVRSVLALVLSIASVSVSAMEVNFEFKNKHMCSNSSPSIKVSEIPSGTTELTVKMTDLDMRSFNHGGGFLQNLEGFPPDFEIPEGALKSYVGPCPPNFSSFGHDYEFAVTAKTKTGETVTASQKRTFSSKEVKD